MGKSGARDDYFYTCIYVFGRFSFLPLYIRIYNYVSTTKIHLHSHSLYLCVVQPLVGKEKNILLSSYAFERPPFGGSRINDSFLTTFIGTIKLWQVMPCIFFISSLFFSFFFFVFVPGVIALNLLSLLS